MLAKTGSHCVGVDFTVPEIIRIVFRRSTSMRLQWWLHSHIGAQYSATEYAMAIVDVLRTWLLIKR